LLSLFDLIGDFDGYQRIFQAKNSLPGNFRLFSKPRVVERVDKQAF